MTAVNLMRRVLTLKVRTLLRRKSLWFRDLFRSLRVGVSDPEANLP